MRLRQNFLLAATGLILISLTLMGVLTWLLVQRLEVSTSFDALRNEVQVVVQDEALAECLSGSAVDCENGNFATERDYRERLAFIGINRQSNPSDARTASRMLLLDSDQRVVWDSQGEETLQTQVTWTRSAPWPLAYLPSPTDFTPSPRETTGLLRAPPTIHEYYMTVGPDKYIAAAAPLAQIPNHRNPLDATTIVKVKSLSNLVTGQPAQELLIVVVFSGSVALVLALVFALLLSSAVSRPLSELVKATGDIARGQYSRRVTRIKGGEFGLVAHSFNEMAGAVEAAREQQRAFLANASHELKTPLTSVIGFSQALIDGSLQTEEERHRVATIVYKESMRVLHTARELLELARVESGQLNLDLQEVDLQSVLREEIDMVSARAADRGLVLNFNPNGRDLPPVKADPERLHQIINNLLDNAVKYSRTDSVVQVVAEGDHTHVEAAIINEVGSYRPDPQKMFERFYRADPSRSSAVGGVGLGLAISRELAYLHRGDLTADFDEEDRLVVRLILPTMAR